MTPEELLRKCTVKIVWGSSLGTGFFVGPGYILTCAHAVKEAPDAKTDDAKTRIEVYWGEQCCDATIVDFKDEIIKFTDRGKEISYRYPDLALLQVRFPNHPCVYLSDGPLSVEDNVSFQSFGYTEDFPAGDSATFDYEGASFIQDQPLLKFKAGQASPGLSGAPLLNLEIHGVSGVVETSRDVYEPKGGRGIPASIIFKTFPQVREIQEEYFSRDNPWLPFLPGKDDSIKDSKQYPVIWLVPHLRNPFFTGRDQVLTDLHTVLTTKEEPLPQAINGLSGVGKTQIALEYAYRYRLEYQAVFWVRADSDPARVADLVKIARELDLPEKNDQDQGCIIEAVKSWLQHHQNWLLILDHVEQDDLEWLCTFCPRGRGHHILLTTLVEIRDKPVESIRIEQMNSEEGVLLILRRAGILGRASEDDQVNAKAIVTAMDGLPLALVQAAAYIKENNYPLQEYLRIFQESPIEILGVVATTLLLSFEKVDRACPAAADLLRFCAFLHPDAIPVDQIIAKGALELGSVLQPVAANPIQLNKAIEALRKFTLVRYNTTTKIQTLTVHRLVQEVLRDSMKKETLRVWIERTIRALNRAFPKVSFKEWSRCQLCLPHVLACFPLIQREGITFVEATQLLNKAGSYLRERAQFAQAMELIKQALTSRKDMLTLEEADEATSLHNMALLYFKQGQYLQAEPYYLSALTIRKNALGLTHPDTATSLNDLAGLYNCQGRYTQAKKLCQQGLEIRKEALTLEHPDTATSLHDLGCIYYNQGKYKQAEEFFRQALDIRKKILDPKNPDAATSINNLARLYYRQGKYKDAESLYQRALDIRQEVLGPDHPDTANSLNDLAQLYYKFARYDQAEPLYQQARDAWTRILGSNPVHPDLATVFNNLAKLYYREGDYTQAKKCYLEALDIRQKTLDGRLIDIGTLLPGLPGVTALPEHPDVATTLNDLGRLYFSQGIFDEAEKLYQHALAIRKKLLVPQHPNIAESLNSLGSLYYKQARYSEAESLYNEALTIREHALGRKHPHVAEILNNLGTLYYRLGQFDKAEDYYQKARRISKQVLGLEHPDTATILNNLAKLYSRQGKFNQAEQLYQQVRTALEILLQKKPLGSGQSPEMATTLHDLASFYTDMGDFAQAEQLYQKALAIRKRVTGPKSPDTASSYHHMGWLYYRQGNYAQAEKLYQQALAIREKTLGVEHPYVAATLNNLARLYYSQGKYKDAEPLYQRALDIRQKALGSDHPYTANSLNDLGRLYYRQGRYTQAEKLCQQALEIRKNVLGTEHRDTALSLTDLAWIYTYLGNYAQAEPLYQQSLAIRERAWGVENPDVADSLNDLAKFYTEKGNYTQAEPLYQRALTIREKFLGSKNPKVAETLNDQANLYAKQGKYEQAEPLYQRALAIREKALAPKHPYIADSLNDLAKFYTEKGNYTQAEPLYQRALAIREEALGPEHPKVAETLNDLANLYTKQGKYEQAEPLYQRARTVLDKTKREAQATELVVRQ